MRNHAAGGCTAMLLLAGASWWPVQAADAPSAPAFCAQCHGEAAPSEFPGVPTIHGLPPGVLENALWSYRERERPCRVTECSKLGTCPDISMCDIVAAMSDADLLALAQWYAAQHFAPHEDPFDATLAARGRAIHDEHCEICHTQLGSDPLDDASMLRGQRKVYLRNALEDFQQGRRESGLTAMDEVLRSFSPGEIRALAEFYSGPAVSAAGTE